MIFVIIRGGGKLTGWGKNGPAYFSPGKEWAGHSILSSGKKLIWGKFRPVTTGYPLLSQTTALSGSSQQLTLK